MICSSFEKLVTYAIDECCSTYECVCEEAKCFNTGNPTCPEGSSRVVVDHDACCSVGKCVYTDLSAAANAKALANIKGGSMSIISHTDSKSQDLIDVSLSNNVQASADAKADSSLAASVGVKKPSSKGITTVTKFVAGQTQIGSSALAHASSNLDWMGHGLGGGWKAQADANAQSGFQMSGPAIHFLSTSGSSESGDIDLNLRNGGKAEAKAEAKGKNDIAVEIINEDGTCIDKLGKRRSYGEQWCQGDNICIVCTCHDVDQIKCSKQSCDPEPTAPAGHKVIRETNGGCCPAYRIVRDNCDSSKCQFNVPTCNLNEMLKTYPLDKCCATYECVCNRGSCPVLSVVPCPDGCTRKVIDPHTCCPVAKCVRDVALSADAQASAGIHGMLGGFSAEFVTGSKDASEISATIKSSANADTNAKAASSTAVETIVKSKGSGKSSTTIQFSGPTVSQQTDASALAATNFGFGGFGGGYLTGKGDAKAESKASLRGGDFVHTIITTDEKQDQVSLSLSGKNQANADASSHGSMESSIKVVEEGSMCTDENGVERYYGETWYNQGNACNLCTCIGKSSVNCAPKVCDPYPTAPEGHVVVEEKADDCCYSYRIVKDTCDMSKCTEYAPVCNHFEDLVTYKVDDCCATYECACNPSKCPTLSNAPCPAGCTRQTIDAKPCCSVGKCIRIDAIAKALAQSNLNIQPSAFIATVTRDEDEQEMHSVQLKSSSHAKTTADSKTEHESKLSYTGKNTPYHTTTAIFNMGQVNAQAAADANVAGHYGIYGGPFGGKGHLAAAADANAGLSYDGGHFEVITKTGGEGGSAVDVSAKGDLSAKADAQASGSHEAEVFVDGGKHGGDMTKFVYTPGQIRADADANAQAAGHLGYAGLPGHFMGQLKADAAAKSDLAFDGGSFSFTHYGDEGRLGDIKAALKGDLEAAADAQVSGSHDAAVRVDGGKKGGSSFELKYHPGQVNAQAAADANVAGHYGIYGGSFGGKGHLAAAADANAGLSYDGGHFEVITKTGGEGGSVIDVSAKGDLSAKADAQASGSHEAEVFVDGGKHGGDMTKFVYTPGQMAAGAKADAAANEYFGFGGVPSHDGIGLSAASSGSSGLSFLPGSFAISHSNDGYSSGSVDAKLSSEANAKSGAEAKSSLNVIVEADICVDSYGRDHKYGESWTDNDNQCKICTCVNVDDVK